MKTLIITISLFIASYIYAGEIFDTNQFYPVSNYPQYIAIGDLNNDNRKDIVISHLTNEIWIYYQDKNNSFKEPVIVKSGGIHVKEIAITDINGDRHEDLIVTQSRPSYLGIFYQKHKSNSLGEEVKYPIKSIIYPNIPYTGSIQIRIADLNRDKRDDIVIWSGLQDPDAEIIVFLQDKKELVKYSQFAVKDSMTFEINTNGELFIACKRDTTLLNNIKVYDINGNLKREIAYKGRANCFKIVDVNNDGQEDLVIGDYAFRRIRLMTQNNGTYKEIDSWSVGIQPKRLAVKDINKDNKPDILVSYNGSHGKIDAFIYKDGKYELKDTYNAFGQTNDLKAEDVMNDNTNDILFLVDENTPNYLHAYFKESGKDNKGLELAFVKVTENITENIKNPKAIEVVINSNKTVIEEKVSEGGKVSKSKFKRTKKASHKKLTKKRLKKLFKRK